MTRTPDWSAEGRDWPHREHSRFIESDGVRWHVQIMGAGPPMLLLHGAGAATHSWRDLAPLLAQHYTIIAPDLPGHGFSGSPSRAAAFSLPSVAAGVVALLGALGQAPRIILGHSAGAAIGVRMALDNAAAYDRVVGINAALLPFPGPFGAWAPVLARGLFYNPLAVALFAARAAQPGAVRALMRGTGSELDARGLELYQRLFRKAGHIEATIGLMAHWDLVALRRELRDLRVALDLIVGDNDRAVPPDAAPSLRGVGPRISVTRLSGLGHLAHEEAPARVAGAVLAYAKESI